MNPDLLINDEQVDPNYCGKINCENKIILKKTKIWSLKPQASNMDLTPLVKLY